MMLNDYRWNDYRWNDYMLSFMMLISDMVSSITSSVLFVCRFLTTVDLGDCAMNLTIQGIYGWIEHKKMDNPTIDLPWKLQYHPLNDLMVIFWCLFFCGSNETICTIPHSSPFLWVVKTIHSGLWHCFNHYILGSR